MIGRVDKNQLLDELRNHMMDIIFTKNDGSSRTMRCTLCRSVMPPEAFVRAEPKFDLATAPVTDIADYAKDDPMKWAEAIAAQFQWVFANSQGDKKPEDYINKDNMFFWTSAIIDAAVAASDQRKFDPNIKVWEIGKGWRTINTNNINDVQICDTV